MVMNLSVGLLLLAGAAAAQDLAYQVPSKPLADLVDVAPTPVAHLSPDRRWLALVERPSLPPLSELSRPELRLAGLRIDPRASAPSRHEYARRVLLRALPDGDERPITGLPPDARVFSIAWAPDSSRLLLVVLEEGAVGPGTGSASAGLHLYLVHPREGGARRLSALRLNAAGGAPPCHWMPDGLALVCLAVPPDRGEAPPAPEVPSGPVVQQSAQRKAASRTFQDLLRSPHDERLLDHHLQAQVVLVPVTGEPRPLGEKGTHLSAVPSMDGAVLLVRTLHRPYSYREPLERFPHRLELWDLSGAPVRTLADLPLRDEIPLGFDAVPEGMRHAHFRDDANASVCWVEARDGGDPKRKAAVRDELLCLDGPRAERPRSIARLSMRFARVRWGSDSLALVEEHLRRARRTRTWKIAPAHAEQPPELIFDRSTEDRYQSPGQPLSEPNGKGGLLLRTTDGGRAIYLEGAGASAEGDHPFLDRLDLGSKQAARLWQCGPDVHEVPLRLFPDGKTLLTRRESKREPPNYFLRPLDGGPPVQLTHHQHPSPALEQVEKRLLRYRRKDGVDLSATLYLPPGHDPKQGPLPLLLWIYPHEFKSADAAGQVRRSQHTFVRPSPTSALFALLLGFAVLEDPALPIIGEGSKEPNDTYVEQLVLGAQAAVDEVVRLGVADPKRIAVGGHSYGAFTAANLLAHTRLFRAGIARSGAYNRTLTPFGFQQEERTYWQAKPIYAALSPFDHADRIQAPLLLIHGEADNNPGTFPLQSERLYDAIKGLGGTARLVLLPHESHGYRARESVLHVLWEMQRWLETYVKPAPESRAQGG